MQEGAAPKFITMIEPTYRLEPAADKMFNVDTAKGIIKDVLEEIFVEEKYAPEDLREKVIEANNAIRTKLVECEDWKRYKIVVNAYSGTMADQGMRIASRCLWNPSTDRSVSHFIRRDGYYVGIVVLATYTE